MQTIILNYCDGKVYIFSHDKTYDTEKMERYLTEKHNFSLNEIEWMTVEKIEFEYL